MRKLFLIVLLFLSSSLFASIGHIMALRGDVSVLRAADSIPATMGMALQQQDTIITKKSSRVQVMLEDKTVITIGSNSNFKFEEYQFDGTANSKASFKASNGFFRSVTGKIGKIAPKRFKLKTKSATIGIRGTDFWGEISPQKEVIACISGAISIELNQGESFEVDAGSLLVVEPKKVEMKKIDTTITPKNSSQKTQTTQKEEQTVTQEVQEVQESLQTEIPQDVIVDDIADVIQQSQEEEEHYIYQEPEPNTQAESLTLTPSTQDRETQY